MTDYRVTPPRINRRLVAEDERAELWALENALHDLARYVEDFQAALDLFDMSRVLATSNFVKQTYPAWMGIAQRDGAMTIYHFGVIVKNGQMLKNCPQLRTMVNHNLLASARKRFERTFPKSERVRHSVGHAAEMTATHAQTSMNALSGTFHIPGLITSIDSKNVTIKGTFDRRYIGTHRGEAVSYELSAESLTALASIASEYFAGFDKLDSEMPQRRRRFPFDES